MEEWKTISVDLHTTQYDGMQITSRIIEAECPYCSLYSTQEVFGGNEMTYIYCPRCGMKIREVSE